MADEYILKSYEGGAETTTLTTPFTIGGTTLGVANGSTFPDGSAGPFVVVVDRGLATEEKFLIDTTTGVNGVTFNIQQVAYDGTSASPHAVGAIVEHCLDAYSIEQANRYVNLQTARGDLVVHNNTTTTKLGVGANNLVLMADSAATTGLKYGQVVNASITDGAVGASKLASASVTAVKIDTAAAGTTGQVLTANTSVASGLEWTTPASGFAMPSGSIVQFAGTSEPAGWLFCRGQTVSRTTYAALFSAIGTSYGAGNGSSTFTLPNFQAKMPVGLDATASPKTWADSLSDTGGSEQAVVVTHTHTTPVHNHTISHTHSGSTVSQGGHDHQYEARHNPTSSGTSNFPMMSTTNANTVAYGLTRPDQGQHGHSLITDTISTANSGDASPTTAAPAGAISATNTANLPPYITVNYLIKT